MDEFLVFFQQWQMDSFYELNSTPISFAYCEDFQQPNNGQQPGLDIKRPAAELTHGGENIRPLKQLKTTTWSSCKTDYNMSDSAPPSSFHVDMKQLQHKVKTLEEQTKKRNMESVVSFKRYEVYADAGINSSSDERLVCGGSTTTEPAALPAIDVGFCNKDVLISIHCERRKGVLERTVAEIEKLHLSVVNSSVMIFGDSAVNVTVIAERRMKNST